MTVGGLKTATGLGADDYLTLCGYDANGVFQFVRLRIDQTKADATAITSENVGSVFVIEGTVTPTISLSSNVITVKVATTQKGGAWIISKKTASGYEHNEAVLTTIATPSYNADTALPTYPIGTARFLNGGDL